MSHQKTALIWILLFFFFSSFAFSQKLRASTLGKTVALKEKFEITVGRSKLVQLKNKPKRMVLSNPGIAYVLMVSKNEVEIIGRNPGVTNLYIWLQEENNQKPKIELIGVEIAVSLPAPNYINSQQNQTMELFHGGKADLILLGHPQERIVNSSPARLSPLESDMPEPCLVPGCI